MKSAWTGFLLSLSLCCDLGIVNVAILRTALRQGGTAGFVLGFGSSVGDLVYFMLAVAGAAALLEWRPFRWVFWIFGTAVLLFLAWRVVREAIRPQKLEIGDTRNIRSESRAALLTTGFGLALASPSAILWFAAVGGSVIAAAGGDRHSLWSFAAGFFAAGVLWSALFAYGAAGMRRLVGVQLVRALSLLSALLFVYFAGVVFFNGWRQLR